MAGGVLKGFGGLFLALGILLVVAGGAAAVYGATDERDNQQDSGPAGIGHDDDRADQNEALVVAGAVAAAIGLVFVILAIVFLVSGGARGRRALERAMREGAQPPAPAPSAGAPLPSGAGTGSAGAAPTRPAQPSAWVGPPPTASRKTGVVVAVVVAAAVVGVIALALSISGSEGGLLGRDEPRDLGAETQPGSTPSTLLVAGVSQAAPDGGNVQVPNVQPGTGRIEFTLQWTPSGGAAPQQLALDVQVPDGDGWTSLASASDGPGLHLNVTGDDLTHVRVVVTPVGAGAMASQAYDLGMRYWSR